MIKPIDYQLDHFIGSADPKVYNSLMDENLHGSELIDNLILLRFSSLQDVQRNLKEHYGIPFYWVHVDPTPQDLREFALKHHVLFERTRKLVCYIPLDTEVDEAELKLDIATHEFEFRYIAACNYNMIQKGLNPNVLSLDLAPFRPLLVFRRLILDCIIAGGTDIHFESRYVNKQPEHKIRYRIKRELKDSKFQIDFTLLNKVVQTAIAKKSSASSIDLDSASGVTTDIADIFGDGSCDLRVTGSRVSAGLYVVIAIQNITTTTKKLDELGFTSSDVAKLRELAKCRTGLTLVTGEMRSGKNTTIFAMLNEIINDPIRIIEYSNPIENRMSFPQINYKGDVELLRHYMRMAKKQDIDIAVLNEIPNAEVAFAVRDLVNSAIGVITTTHLNRVWHLPYKLEEFFGKDYKTIISQINAVVNHKMFRRVKCPKLQRRELYNSGTEFEKACWRAGVRQYYVPEDPSTCKFEMQPIVEILILTEAEKTAILNFEGQHRAEEMLRTHAKEQRELIEYKLADLVNRGICLIDEMRSVVG